MKNLIKNKSTKKATKNNNNFITPSYITRAGSLLNGVVDGGMAKQGFYDTESSIPNFYTTELTPDTWLLPRSRAEILRWCRLFFNLDPYINSILTMHAQYPICNFRLSYKDKDTEEFFNRKLFFNKEFSWIDFLEQLMLSYLKLGEAVIWGDFSEANGTWTNFTLIDPALINYKEDPMSGDVEMSIIPTRELKEMIADALKQGRQDVPIEYIKCVQENHEIPLDASEVEANYLTGRKYSPARVFMMARRTDPASTRGVPMIQSCFKTLIYSDKIKLAQIACASGDTKVRLLDGQVKTMEELYKSNEKDFWVYSCTEKGEIVYKKASKVICNGKKQLYKIKLDNGDYLRFTADHPFLMRDGSWKEVKDLKPGDSLMPFKDNSNNNTKVWNHKVVSVEKDAIENVYDIESVDDTHTFGVVTSDGSGVFVHNCADRLHLPIEIWSVGQYTGDPNTSIIPDDTMLANVREAIREATMQPPFSIFVPPYIKYEAVGVNGKLLSVYEDLGYVENCIFVALGVNKNLILGQGPSFSSSKQTSLFKLIKMYKMMRLKLEAFIKRYIILPIAKANDIKDEYGEYVVPEIEWEESLQPEQDVEMFNNVLKLWDKGLVSTMTLYEYFPGQLDINLEKKRMEEEKRSVFDKGTDRLGAKSLREDLKEDSPESKSTPKPSDGKGPAKDMPSPISGGEALEGLEKGEEATPPEGGSEPTPPTPPEGLEGE